MARWYESTRCASSSRTPWWREIASSHKAAKLARNCSSVAARLSSVVPISVHNARSTLTVASTCVSNSWEFMASTNEGLGWLAWTGVGLVWGWLRERDWVVEWEAEEGDWFARPTATGNAKARESHRAPENIPRSDHASRFAGFIRWVSVGFVGGLGTQE